MLPFFMNLLILLVRFLLRLLMVILREYLKKGFKHFSTNSTVKKLLNINGKDYEKVFKQEFKKTWNSEIAKIKSKNELKAKAKQILEKAEKQATEKVINQISQAKKPNQRTAEIISKITRLPQAERKQLERLNKLKKTSNDMFWTFNSSWIIWGVWVPYRGARRNQGYLSLQLRTRSKRNPASLYTWKNIWISTAKYLSIAGQNTGTEFWKIFYHQNRKNKYHLLKSSIYWLSGHYRKTKGV